MELTDLALYRYLQQKDTKLCGQVLSVYDLVKPMLNGTSGCFKNYTMHDVEHSLRVAKYMGELACGIDVDKNCMPTRIREYNAFEIALILLCALLHDIGMVIRPSDEEQIKNNQLAHCDGLAFQSILAANDNSEVAAIQEIIRRVHAERVEDYVRYHFEDSSHNNKSISSYLQLDDKYDYTDEVIRICIAHGKDHDFLKTLSTFSIIGNYSFNSQYIAVLLRIADYMDLDPDRAPVLWFHTMEIKDFSKAQWKMHDIIQNKRKLVKGFDGKLQIRFEGKSCSPKIHRLYLSYLKELHREIERSSALLNNFNSEERHRLNLILQIDDHVETQGFGFCDLRLVLDHTAIMQLLMDQSLYGERSAGLRELIQNAVDACMVRKEQEDSEMCYAPQIIISISKSKDYVKITDNGIGMTYDTIQNYFLNIGRSYYKSDEFKFYNHKYKPIGQFGIGFLVTAQ